MSLLGKLFGAEVKVDAGQVVGSIGQTLDELFTSDDERAQGAALLEKLRQAIPTLQIKLNEIEAASPSLFVAGWRPAAGWVCVAGLFYNSIGRPLLQFLLNVFLTLAHASPELARVLTLPALDIGDLITLLLGMLGLGGLRTFEKREGVARG